MPTDLPRPLYRQLADHYRSAMQQGTLAPGDRFPSVRSLRLTHGVSVSTALSVCRTLEDEGWLRAKPRSGYYVSEPQRKRLQPALEQPQRCVMDGSPYVSMNQHISETLARADAHPGPLMRLQIAVGDAALYPSGMMLAPDEITITSGGTEAVNLAIRATTEAGDVVAVESPLFYGLLQILESLGRKVVEIPAHPTQGLSLEALEFSLQNGQQPVKAVICMPIFQNPLGCSMPDINKAALVALCDRHGIALIEDDIYAYMGLPGTLPRPLKAWDTRGGVIHCSSLNKTLAPGMRLGWLAGGRWQERIEMLKYAHSRFPEEIGQVTLARFMETSAFDRHVLRMQQRLRTQREHTADAVSRHFPASTRLSVPDGGLLLWLQLAEHIQADAVFEEALQQGIRIAPGSMFSNSRRFDHCLRLSCGASWTHEVDEAVRRVGAIVHEML